MRSLSCGQAPAHPLFDGPCCYGAHVVVDGGTDQPLAKLVTREHRPTNKLLRVKPYCVPEPVHMGFLTLQCLVLKKKQFTSLLWHNPSNSHQDKAHHGQSQSLNTIWDVGRLRGRATWK